MMAYEDVARAMMSSNKVDIQSRPGAESCMARLISSMHAYAFQWVPRIPERDCYASRTLIIRRIIDPSYFCMKVL